MSEPIRARVFKGTRDLMPEDMIPRQRMLEVMRGVFERFGFAPVETPVMEFLDILLGKYGVEGEKLIYPLAYRDGKTLALRYDLTVPLSRLVAMRPDLPLPFKRYQVQPVYRADSPQLAQGRFREFYQCDVDTVGTDSIVADAENLAVCYEVYRALDLIEAGLEMRVNHRKILRALVEAAGLGPEMDHPVFTILDKIDKIGREKVEELLAELGLPGESLRHLLESIDLVGSPQEILEALSQRLKDTATGPEGLSEMKDLFAHLDALGVPRELVRFDLVLTRGLDYYTGPVYEFRLTGLENFGSLGGGGRYDDLLNLYGKRSIPATGVSIGLSRVESALRQLGKMEESSTPTRALVLRFEDVAIEESLALVRHLRDGGVATELSYDVAKFKKQIGLADKRGIPFVVVQGRREIEDACVQVKNLETGEQKQLSLDEAVAYLKP